MIHKRPSVFRFWPITVLSALITVGYLSFTDNLVKTTDLVPETLHQTSWQRPKQWTPVRDLAPSSAVAVGAVYGDQSAKEGKSHSIVLLSQSRNRFAPSHADNAFYTTVRQEVMQDDSFTAPLEAAVKQNTHISCIAAPTSKKEADHTQTATMISIARITTRCTVDGGAFIIKARIAVGKNDGLLRYIALASSDHLWDKNSSAYERILEDIVEVGDQQRA